MTMPIFFDFFKSDTNHHGTQKPGEPWSSRTVKGPKFKWIKLERHSPGFSRRLIFYFPSGKCWFIDVFSKLKVKP